MPLEQPWWVVDKEVEERAIEGEGNVGPDPHWFPDLENHQYRKLEVGPDPDWLRDLENRYGHLE